MPLDPQIEYVLGLVEKAGYPELCDMSPDDAREFFDMATPKLDAKPENVFRVDEHYLQGARGDSFGVRIYTPHEPAEGEKLPVLVYIHGGGFVVGSLDSYDSLCRVLANRAGCIVVSVDYRLAPEAKFPAAVEDCFDALEWVEAHAETFDGDPDRIVIAGDSAGGNLAAVTAILARDAGGPDLKGQILIYPVTAPTPESYSHHAFAEKLLLTRRNILWFFDHYLNGPEDQKDPRFAPLETADLSGLPPTLLIVAGYDPLRDEGLAYGERLKAAGNEIEVTNYEGMIHGFFSMSGAVDEAKKAVDQVAAEVRRRLA